jgi:hypothetical protein
MNKTDKTDTLKKNMIHALEKSLGVVTTACKAVGVSRDSHYRWMKEDEAYLESVKALEGMTLDFAESKLHEQILEGNTTAIIFFLKCKGKVRGYVERQEISVEKSTPDLSGMSTEELIDLATNGDD